MNEFVKARIAYNGPLLKSGEMDIRELAPSLLAFADLIENANKVLGSERKIQILLNHDSIRRGSFDITTILQYSALEQVKLFVSAADKSGLTSLMLVLGWGTIANDVVVGVFSLIKKIRNRHIKKIEPKGENKVILHIGDTETIVTSKDTLKVFMNINCREAIEKVVKPLEKDGIDSFELRNPDELNNKEPLEIIQKDEVSYFKAPTLKQEEEKEILPEREITVKITSLTFDKNNKWRLTDGNNTFWAKIEDNEFLNKVENGEISFSNGDMLRIAYYIQQTLKNDALSSEYIVTKVLELKKRPDVITLDFYEE